MLRGLSIRNMLLIERLDLDFQAGLNVLTGETGAGKSILLDSLGFVLGWRGRADLVRSGADRGEVTATFELEENHPAIAVLRDAGLDEGFDLIMRRINAPDGRKQAYVNDRRCSGEVLRQLSAHLVELHGQHDDRGLLNPRGHKTLLDDYAQLGPKVTATRAAWREVSKAKDALETCMAKIEKAESDRAFLEHASAELEVLNPQTGEDAELDTKRRLMQAAGRIREDIQKASAALGGDGAEGAISDATRWLQDVEDKADGRLSDPIAALSRALSELGEAQRGVDQCLSDLDFNPHDLEQVEERLFALRALGRKHGIVPDDLGRFHADISDQLQLMSSAKDEVSKLELELTKARKAYDTHATTLSEQRNSATRRLDDAMALELAPLKMERAVFVTDISKTEPSSDGHDAVQFTVATNPGAPSGPINKIASGGELSRFLLALKVCLTSEASGITMIFDEIDRGVGGATADAVGRRLASLAEQGQVLVVTHSPQVAALGRHHWRVEKSTQGTVTTSDVVPVLDEDRVTEIARMLAGDSISDEARAAATVLLAAR